MQPEFTSVIPSLPKSQYLNRIDYQLRHFRIEPIYSAAEQPSKKTEVTLPVEIVLFAYAQKDDINGQLLCRTSLDKLEMALSQFLQTEPVGNGLPKALEFTSHAVVGLARTFSSALNNSVSLAILIFKENSNPGNYKVLACTVGDCTIYPQKGITVRRDQNYLGESIDDDFVIHNLSNNNANDDRIYSEIKQNESLVAYHRYASRFDTEGGYIERDNSLPHIKVFVSREKVERDRRRRRISNTIDSMKFFLSITLILSLLSLTLVNGLPWVRRSTLGLFNSIKKGITTSLSFVRDLEPGFQPTNTPTIKPTLTETPIPSTPQPTAPVVAEITVIETGTVTATATSATPVAAQQDVVASNCPTSQKPTIRSPDNFVGFQVGTPINFEWQGELQVGTGFEIQFNGMGCTTDFCGIMNAAELTAEKLGHPSGIFRYQVLPNPGFVGTFQWRVAVVIPDDPTTSINEYKSCVGSEQKTITIAPGTVPNLP